jgi:hypothetical protein
VNTAGPPTRTPLNPTRRRSPPLAGVAPLSLHHPTHLGFFRIATKYKRPVRVPLPL